MVGTVLSEKGRSQVCFLLLIPAASVTIRQRHCLQNLKYELRRMPNEALPLVRVYRDRDRGPV
jgi:hypothetical protein